MPTIHNNPPFFTILQGLKSCGACHAVTSCLGLTPLLRNLSELREEHGRALRGGHLSGLAERGFVKGPWKPEKALQNVELVDGTLWWTYKKLWKITIFIHFSWENPLFLWPWKITMFIHFSWENPLFLWPFSIAMLVHQRVYLGIPTPLKNMSSSLKVNGKDDIPYMKWKMKVMFETTNQIGLIHVDSCVPVHVGDPELS